MNALIWLHRWVGAVLGIVLVVLALSGTALLWEDAWIGVPGADDAPVGDVAALARVIDTAQGHAPGLSRVTFAGGGMGLHHAAYESGGGVYIDGSGIIAEQWQTVWERPELWLFDLHHYLLAGDTGEVIVGTAGLAGLFFVITGAIIWWRTRRTFDFRLWPRRLTRSAIVRQHRDLGIIVAPILLLLFLTGAAMVFGPVRNAIIAPFPAEAAVSNTPSAQIEPRDPAALLREGRRTLPNAEFRRLQFSDEGLILRMRQDFEWTPNGRSYLREEGGAVTVDAPDGTLDRRAVSEKFYPLHSGKVGGLLWRMVLMFGGLALAMLGALTVWSFWRAQAKTGTQAATFSLQAERGR